MRPPASGGRIFFSLLKISVKHYDDLTKDEFHDLIALRIEVFVIEQNCPYQEVDGLDKDAYHLILRSPKQEGIGGHIIGTVRILKAGVSYKELAIGRVVSSPKFRGQGLGHLMMEACMKFIEDELGHQDIRLSAQTHLRHYYERYGFTTTGKDYLEDGIPHSEMLFTAKSAD